MARRMKEIRIMVSEEEYERIFRNSKKLDMQTAPYIRAVAQSPTIVCCDYRIISEHTEGDRRNPNLYQLVDFYNRIDK